jgi:hypothetical protein
LIQVPTLLIVSGDCLAFVGDESVRITGYHVIAANEHRKQAFQALADTTLTMIFASSALTVEAAEEEFTPQFECLLSRHPDAVNHVIDTRMQS